MKLSNKTKLTQPLLNKFVLLDTTASYSFTFFQNEFPDHLPLSNEYPRFHFYGEKIFVSQPNGTEKELGNMNDLMNYYEPLFSKGVVMKLLPKEPDAAIAQYPIITTEVLKNEALEIDY